MQYDLRAATLDEFVAFLFDHPVAGFHENPAQQPRDEPWYWSDIELAYQATHNCSLFERLFAAPQFLLDRFTRGQLNQGFWAAQSGNLEGSAFQIVWESTIPLDLRKACISSMFHLYDKLFAVDPLGTCSEMWWDSFAYAYHLGHRSRDRNDEERQFRTRCSMR